MNKRGVASFVGPSALGLGMVAGFIWETEGPVGFRPFLNIEALGLVLLGTLACLWMAYPLGEVWRALKAGARSSADPEEASLLAEVLRYGADCAMGMGGAGTVFGLILLLSSIDDVAALPRRMALSLDASFYGLLLSEALFMPLWRRASRPRAPGHGLVLVDTGARRFLVALLAVGGGVLQFFVILYALCAALPPATRLR